MDSKKAYDSIRREVLYNTLIDTGIPMKLVMLIKLCLNETYSRVRIGKNLSDMFPIWKDLKQGDSLSPLLFNSALEYVYAIRRVQINEEKWKLNVTHQLLIYVGGDDDDDDDDNNNNNNSRLHISRVFPVGFLAIFFFR